MVNKGMLWYGRERGDRMVHLLWTEAYVKMESDESQPEVSALTATQNHYLGADDPKIG